MDIATNSNNATKSIRKPMIKIAILLVISLGLFWFSEDSSQAQFFEPQSIGWILWVSYAKDLIQPFALYFFICLGEGWLSTFQKRALLALALPVLLELGQGLYHPVGRYIGAFDPLDVVVYLIGVGLAVLVEQKVVAKLLKFW